MNRKDFISTSAMSTGVMMILPGMLLGREKALGLVSPIDPLPAEKVKDFVSAGHNNLDKVKTLLTEFPTLIFSTWDHGGGDFETGLEGAGHVGNKEIANYLIGQGARINLFVLTMLGKTEIVQAWLKAYPDYLNARGPHGFTLLHHAQRGGNEAKELLEFLQSKGLKETRIKI